MIDIATVASIDNLNELRFLFDQRLTTRKLELKSILEYIYFKFR